MYELEIELDDDITLDDELPSFPTKLKQNRFWVYKTIYQGKISFIIVDMQEKNRYLYFENSSSKFGSIYMLEEGEIFEIEYLADFNNWTDFITQFSEYKKMGNLVCLIISAGIEEE